MFICIYYYYAQYLFINIKLMYYFILLTINNELTYN
jgi:hypothetical protein